MKNRQPLFHVVKREQAGPGQQVLAYVAAVALALAVGAVLLKVQGVEPLTFYRQMLTMGIPGSRYPWRAVENFIKLFVPLLIVSLALSLAFKMRFWNIGGEGQFIMGAFWAGFAAMKLGGGAAPARHGGRYGPLRGPGRRAVRGIRGGAEGALRHQRDPAHTDAQLCGPVFSPIFR